MALSKRNYESDYYSYGRFAHKYKPKTQYTERPNNLSVVRSIRSVKKPYKTRRKLNWRGKIIILGLISFFVAVVVPTFINNITKPILLRQVPYKSITSDKYNFLLKPTTKYLYNSDFMDTKMLIGASKKPLMQPLFYNEELTDLKDYLVNLSLQYPQLQSTIYVWDARNGNYVNINGETPYPAASIIKIPVLISLFKTIEAGKTNLKEQIPLSDYYKAEGSGSLQYMQNGTPLSIDTLAKLMITESDNSSTNMLMSVIGSMTSVNDDIKSWGLKNTYIQTWLPDLGGTNYTTTKDLATMLFNLDNENFLQIESRANIFDYMGHVKNNRLLAAGIPSNASIAHKTGDIGKMLGDAGIVYTPEGRKYIVAIMVKRPHNDYSGKEFIVRASEAIYEYMSNY